MDERLIVAVQQAIDSMNSCPDPMHNSALDNLRQAFGAVGALGDFVTFRLYCPRCGWRHEWNQFLREPGRFSGLCRRCGERMYGDDPATVVVHSVKRD